VSTVQEIKAAILELSAGERRQLMAELPALLPELNGDAAWERILHDPRLRPALSALLDKAETESRRREGLLRETSEEEFGRTS
jgi:hypothetical protein